MPANKRKNRSGKVVWFYKFQPLGATRGTPPIREFGFATKREAEDAEAMRRIEEQQKYDAAKNGVGISAPLPKTLAMLFEEFFREHAEKKLAPKTIERYHEQAASLDAEMLSMPLKDITPLHLNREWNRLLDRGGRSRRDKTQRPLSAKSVRNIAGVVSSAFLRAIKWGLVATNPVTNSEPPVPKKSEGMALVPAEQTLLTKCASGPWCLPMLLELAAGSGARRGEIMALRWSDIRGGEAFITRSLTQTRQGLQFKGTKSERPRRVEIPPSVQVLLEAHRQRQEQFHQQFGPDYRTDLDLIFANPDGTPLKPDSISATVFLLCRKLGLPKGASLHTLRHTHGSFLLADGVDLATVSERLGHSSIRVTADIYSHALRGRDQEAALRWDRFMGQHDVTRRKPERVN